MGYYVTNRNAEMIHVHRDTQEEAVEWACSTAPAKPPKGFRWEVWRSDGVRVAVIRYNPQPQVTHG